jgi:uncharacterized protein YuzE
MLARAKAVSFDEQADAAYVAFSDEKVARTEEIDDGVVFDIDSRGGIVGVEILSVSRRAGANDPRSWAAGVAEGLLSRKSAAA